VELTEEAVKLHVAARTAGGAKKKKGKKKKKTIKDKIVEAVKKFLKDRKQAKAKAKLAATKQGEAVVVPPPIKSSTTS